MSTNIAFKNVTGFNLKWPSRRAPPHGRPEISGRGEWIEINKKVNQLPTARLKTWVLYFNLRNELE